MSDLPKISIVMPSLNQAPFLRQAMESVLEQDYPNLEFIVVDGGSTDDSISIIRSMEKHLSWWVSEEDDGQAAAINKGFEQATGQLLGWLNSDDYFLDGALHKVSEAHRRSPAAGLVVGNGLRVDEHGMFIGPFSRIPIVVDSHTLAYGVDYLLQPSTFFTHSAWKTVGGLRDDLKWCLDWDLWIRIVGAYPVEQIDALLAVSREYRGTKTATGAFERWAEIREVTESHTGMQLTPGALAYFLHTLHDYLHDDPRAIQLMTGLRPVTGKLWAHVTHVCLKRLTGRFDGFPTLTPPKEPLNLALDELRDNLLDRQEAATRERRKRMQDILVSLSSEVAEGGRDSLHELAGHLDNLQRHVAEQDTALVDLKVRLQQVAEQLDHHAERLHTMEQRLLVRAGKMLRLI